MITKRHSFGEVEAFKSFIDTDGDDMEDQSETESLETGDTSKGFVSESNTTEAKMNIVSRTGLMVLLLLALHNCFHTLLMRFVMKDRPKFLTSAAVLGTEVLKFTVSVCYIVFYEGKSIGSILHYLRVDYRNTLLLVVPASA